MSEVTKIDDGGPAMPVAEDHKVADELEWTRGLSIRDWFAGQAIAGLISFRGLGDVTASVRIATNAYAIADAMLAERKAKP